MKRPTLALAIMGIALFLLSTGQSSIAADSGSGTPPDERVLINRAYQQGVARRRAAEAKASAALQHQLEGMDAAQKYECLIAAAQNRAAAGEFQRAIAAFNDAMAVKPADVAVSAEVSQLKVTLEQQSKPVSVTFQSDGMTFVAVVGARLLEPFANTQLAVLPGDYEIIGRREGFQEIRRPLHVRSGEPMPVVTVVCTEATPIAP